MTTSEERRRLLQHLEGKEFRDALVEADMANGILFQLKAMLEDRGWTQEELAEKAGTSQPVISKYLAGYENFSLKTLKRLASAFDVSFASRFEPFNDLAKRHLNVDWATLIIPDYANDAALREPVAEYAVAASGDIVPASVITGSHSAQTSMQVVEEQLDFVVTYDAAGANDSRQQKDDSHDLAA